MIANREYLVVAYREESKLVSADSMVMVRDMLEREGYKVRSIVRVKR